MHCIGKLRSARRESTKEIELLDVFVFASENLISAERKTGDGASGAAEYSQHLKQRALPDDRIRMISSWQPIVLSISLNE